MNEVSGARFSQDGNFRFALWRVWDKKLPKVMFIGLNPSIAAAEINDPTTTRICAISKFNGFGGVYLVNCFPFVSTNPKDMTNTGGAAENLVVIGYYAAQCSAVVFAWGNFKIVQEFGMDKVFEKSYPNALCIEKNKNGSPKHPLYCRIETKFIPYNTLSVII